MAFIDPIYTSRVEHNITPPMRTAVTLPLAVHVSCPNLPTGVVIYVAQSAFSNPPLPDYVLTAFASEIAAYFNGGEVKDVRP